MVVKYNLLLFNKKGMRQIIIKKYTLKKKIILSTKEN